MAAFTEAALLACHLQFVLLRFEEILDGKMKAAARGHGLGADDPSKPAYATSHLSGRALADMALASVARAEGELRKVRRALPSITDLPPYQILTLYRAVHPPWCRIGKKPQMMMNMARAIS